MGAGEKLPIQPRNEGFLLYRLAVVFHVTNRPLRESESYSRVWDRPEER